MRGCMKTVFWSSLPEILVTKRPTKKKTPTVPGFILSFMKVDSRFTSWKHLIWLSLSKRINSSGCAQRKERMVTTAAHSQTELAMIPPKFCNFYGVMVSGQIDQLEMPKDFCHSGNSLFNLKYEPQNGIGCLLPCAAARLIFTSIFNEIRCRMQQERRRQIRRAARRKRCSVMKR